MLPCLQATGVMLEGLHDIIISLQAGKLGKSCPSNLPSQLFLVCLLTVHEFHNFKTMEIDSNSLFSVQLQNELQCRPVASLRPSLRSSLLLYRQHSFDARDLCIKVAPLDNRLNRPCVSFSGIPSFGPP